MSDLNPGIRNLVALLNANGYPTCDSGDGKTHDFGCDREHAYVSIQTNGEMFIEDEARALKDFMERQGVKIHPCNPDGKPYISASYDPADNTAILDLNHVDDAMLAASTERMPSDG